MMIIAENVDAYIARFPEQTQELLQQMRALIKAAAPEAEELISYQMPAYKFKGILVYFAGYKKHIGFYPTGSGIQAFKDELADYKYSKGAVQFPLNKPLPVSLITQMLNFRVVQNMEEDELKGK